MGAKLGGKSLPALDQFEGQRASCKSGVREWFITSIKLPHFGDVSKGKHHLDVNKT